MNILLKEVTSDNWMDCVHLKVSEAQKHFVATNSFSLAQSKYEPDFTPMCIYDDETMVGFVMFGIDEDEDKNVDDEFWICRFMIDEKFQGKGYGKKSMAKIIEYIGNNYNYDEVYLSEVPENEVAKGLYKSFGFEFTGEVEDEEEVMVLKLKSSPAVL
ncbi:GNAT family N-acetyltransferase [Clostridium tagluense]|uniref:GNAT family N-acetyltransferase n=1 Tax=Clostridium tagluense TaxID=360422 RepID=UPI001CF40698|nr:GNAT family N-acetyltransferase [Clostridium tagluense]MCB2300316.1 GNAT family N-acetyltransferase [Clostridium tagluense]